MDEQLGALEQQRCRAIGERDLAKLESLLAADYVHVHSDGRVERRDDWLAVVGSGPARTTERGRLEIASLGDTAVMVGPVVTTVFVDEPEPRVIDGTATQTWARGEDGWELLSFQVTSRKRP